MERATLNARQFFHETRECDPDDEAASRHPRGLTVLLSAMRRSRARRGNASCLQSRKSFPPPRPRAARTKHRRKELRRAERKRKREASPLRPLFPNPVNPPDLSAGSSAAEQQ